MKSSVRDIIDGALEVIGNTSRTEWAQDWPCQAVLVAEFINATTLMQEAIKGGTGALKSLMDKYQEHQIELIEVLKGSGDTSTMEIMSMVLIQDQHTRNVVLDLIDNQVISEKEYAWKSRPRCYSTDTDIVFEMLAIKEIYRYEYLGDYTQPVMYKNMERTIYNFISSYAMKVFPVLKGGYSRSGH